MEVSCISFTCLYFCSCKMTSQTVEEKTLRNKLSLVPFLFLYFPFLLQFLLPLFLFSPSAYVDPYCLSWFHKLLLLLMSLMPQIRERSSRWSVLKWSHAHPKRRWQESMGAISHNTSFTHCHVLNLIHAWSRWKVVVTWVSPPNFGSQHCFRFRNRMQLNMDGLRLNTLSNKLPFLIQI